MKKIYFIIFYCLFSSTFLQAQIISLDTVCVGTPVNFTSPCDTAVTYAWAFSAVNADQPLSQATTVASGNSFAVSACITMNYDNGNFYSFNTNHGNDLVKLTYGNSPFNTPTIIDMGSLNGALNSSVTEDVDIIMDSSTATWYGFIADGEDLVTLNFGNSLDNTPTTAITNLSAANVNYGMQISVMKYNGQWIGFLGNYTTNFIVRLDFGTSLASTPTATDLPDSGYLGGPCYFALHQQDGNWYMIVTNLNNATLVRYAFGADLQNNSPTETSLGNPGAQLLDPRGITFVQTCDSFYGYMMNEDATFFKMDFQNDITNSPTLTDLGGLGAGNGLSTLFPFWYNDSLYFYISSFDNYIYRVTSYGLPPGGTYSYVSPQTTYTFPVTGIYPITLFCNQGSPKQRHVFCKDVVVVAANTISTSHDTTLCAGSPLVLQTTVTGSSYVWNTGADTSAINVTQSGTYYVSTLTDSCAINIDTFHVTFLSAPTVALGNDTTLCSGNILVMLSTQPIGSTYNWNTGSTGDSIHVTQAGTYWLAVNNNVCTASDTIQIAFNTTPVVNLGNDTILCQNTPITLQSSGTYSNAAYLWNTNDVTPFIEPTQSGTYWLDITENGCTGKDTVNVTFIPTPVVDFATNISTCQGDSVLIGAAPVSGDTYQWNTGSTQDSIHILQNGVYWLTVTRSNGCTASDTANVVFSPSLVVSLGNDTDLCSGHSITLQSVYSYTGATYLWNTGNNNAAIQTTQAGTYWLQVTKNGCSGADTMVLSVIQSPIVQIGNDTTICQGNILMLASTQPSGAMYEWNNGSSNSTIIASQSGTYWLAVTDSGCTATDTMKVTVNPSPDVNLGNDTSICNGQNITLGSSNTFSNATYAWSTGAATPTIQASQNSSYWLSVNENGCVGSDTVVLTLKPVPSVSLGGDTSFCTGTPIVLTPTVMPDGSNPTYVWNTGSTGTSISVSQPGIYGVTVTENGCTNSDSVIIQQNSRPLLNLGDDTTLCLGTAFTLSAGNDPINNIVWLDGSTGNTFNVTTAGKYFATATNQCGTVSDTIQIDYQYCNIWFPSAFTPNNDGRNEIIKAVGGLNEIYDYSLYIFNRWGQLVYETVNVYDGWNGTFNGVAQPIGTYNYMIHYSFEGKTYMMKGNFELIR